MIDRKCKQLPESKGMMVRTDNFYQSSNRSPMLRTPHRILGCWKAAFSYCDSHPKRGIKLFEIPPLQPDVTLRPIYISGTAKRTLHRGLNMGQLGDAQRKNRYSCKCRLWRKLVITFLETSFNFGHTIMCSKYQFKVICNIRNRANCSIYI